VKQATPRELTVLKLLESGLDAKDARVLELEALTPQQVQRLDGTFTARPGMRIPYFDVRGKPTGFYRLRYLGPPPSLFGEQPTRIIKYVQPPETGTAAYFPRLVDWAKALKPKQPLFLTEGELKSAKACKDGIPTIGLGGVFNFQSARLGVPFLPELEAIDWAQRPVNIIFDSDYATNPHVRIALHRLMTVLTSRGARPRVVTLPNLPDRDKTGLDDYLVSQGRDEFEELVNQATEGLVATTLWSWNDRFAFIQDPGLIVDLDSGQRLSTQKFENEHYRNVKVGVQVPLADGTVRLKDIAVPTLWLDWPHRFELQNITYAPGQPRVLDGAYNLWRGWGCESRKGDVRLWTQLLDHVFHGDPESREWFERWAAYPVQKPGTKLYTAVVLWSLQHGVGKSLLGEALSRVYGNGENGSPTNSSEISQEELTSTFTSWLYAKQFVFGDEVTGSDNHAFADKIKKMITQRTARVNQKFVPEFYVPDVANHLYTTNKSNAFYIENHDRRYFIKHVNEMRFDFRAGKLFATWFRSPEGGAALRYHLEHVNLKGFEPQAPALVTRDKLQAIEESQTDAGLWLHELRTNPDSTLLLDLATAPQVLAEYERTSGRVGRLSVNGIARELTKAGFKKFNDDKFVYVHGHGARYWVLKREAHWAKGTAEQAKKYLEDSTLTDQDVKKGKY
jgi:hypothetical protein